MFQFGLSEFPNEMGQAPQHTANSWASHWHQRHDIADKILATYRELDFDASDDQQDEEEEGEVLAEIKDDQDDDDDTMSANETSRDQKGRLRSEGTFSGDTDVVDTEEDEANMGEPGSSFTRGDWCILARFIARNHWDEMSHKERWQAFTETVCYPPCVRFLQNYSWLCSTRLSDPEGLGPSFIAKTNSVRSP